MMLIIIKTKNEINMLEMDNVFIDTKEQEITLIKNNKLVFRFNECDSIEVFNGNECVFKYRR